MTTGGEAEDAPPGEIDPQKINLEPVAIPPQNSTDPVEEVTNETDNAASQTLQTDPAYLREIGKEISNQGFLFTGFAYTDPKAKIALRLASKCDVLILDWNLGSGDCTPSLELLTALKDSGTPRFVFILTDESKLDGIRQRISAHLGEETTGTGLVFDCGPFSFSLKNKPQTGGENTVQPEDVLNEAVAGIQSRFGGLLQLASLQMLSSYKGTLHEVLAHFRSELDMPFIAEWLEENSPIGANSCFKNLMIDEWRSLVEKRPSPDGLILSNEGISAFISSKKDVPEWGGESALQVRDKLPKQKNSFPTEGADLQALEQELKDWMTNSNGASPQLAKPGGGNWKPEALRSIIWGYLSISCNNTEDAREQLTHLDAFFHTQPTLPSCLNQGTVLKRKSCGTHLICITPTCDCERPETRINKHYSFLQANRITPEKLNTTRAGSIVSIRTKNNETYLLEVTLKPALSFRVEDPCLNKDLQFINSFSSKQGFQTEPISQLRPSRVRSLVSLTAGKALEVGLDRSELLQTLCQSN